MDLSSIRDLTAFQAGTGALPNVTKPSNMSTGDLILVWISMEGARAGEICQP